MIPTNTGCLEITYEIDGLDRIRAVSDDVAAAEHCIVDGLFRMLNAGFKRFQVGMDVTEDEIAHGV